MKQVYLDYSATTPVKKEVLDEMIPFFSESFGNPSSAYALGRNSKEAINRARKQVASLIGANDYEVTFTSSGTEANNWAIFGVCDAMKNKGNHIITTKTEHPAIISQCKFLEERGYEVTYLDVQSDGLVDINALENAITKNTILISIMFVNNEIGTIQPIKELNKIAKKHNVLFHSDAVQALGSVMFDVKDLDIDLMSISAHKIYGPKGIGALYIKDGLVISNLIHGGSQENKKRPGTENLTGIIGFGKAAEITEKDLAAHIERLTELREYFIEKVMSLIPDVVLNGHRSLRHPGNANLRFSYIEGETMMEYLNYKGIYVSTGSACSSSETTPSHVLMALNIPIEHIHSSLRFTLGDFTTKEDIDFVIGELVEMVEKFRMISPTAKIK